MKTDFLSFFIMFLSNIGIMGVVILVFSSLFSLLSKKKSNFYEDIRRVFNKLFCYKLRIVMFSAIAALLEELPKLISYWDEGWFLGALPLMIFGFGVGNIIVAIDSD